MKRTQKSVIISLVVLALLPGFVGFACAAPPVKIAGVIYLDNTPGTSTANGLDGATVTLMRMVGGVYQPATAANAGIAGPNPVITGGDGLYAFNGLKAGTYEVVETPPSGFQNYKPAAGYKIYVISASSSDQAAQNFFVYQIPAATISGGIYLDNTPGTSTDSGLGGATVTLMRLQAGIYVPATTANSGITGPNPVVTGEDGLYTFGTISQVGTYEVVETLPDGYKAYAPGAGYKKYVISGSSGDITGQNFFAYEIPAATISGGIYLDETRDTLTGSGLPGATVTFMRMVKGEYIAATPENSGITGPNPVVTGEDGLYTFGTISQVGAYRVVVTPPDGYQVYKPGPGYITYVISGSLADYTDQNFFAY